MRKLVIGMVLAAAIFSVPAKTEAHRSGCHRWHSCPSDTGSYICGDLGYTSGCPNTYVPTPTTPTQIPAPKTTSNQPKIPPPAASFVGKPTTYAQLYTCEVVGNSSSMIYHTKGSKFIREMNLKNKKCFTSTQEAVNAGFRKAKTKG